MLAFLKQIFDKKSEKFYYWAFATNQSTIDLDYIIPTYKKRWRIETGFRVQDEARISSKSIDPRIRFFFFAYGQILQLLWVVLYKEDVGRWNILEPSIIPNWNLYAHAPIVRSRSFF